MLDRLGGLSWNEPPYIGRSRTGISWNEPPYIGFRKNLNFRHKAA